MVSVGGVYKYSASQKSYKKSPSDSLIEMILPRSYFKSTVIYDISENSANTEKLINLDIPKFENLNLNSTG